MYLGFPRRQPIAETAVTRGRFASGIDGDSRGAAHAMPSRRKRQQVHSAALAEAVRKIGRVSLTKALETVANRFLSP
jgi:hypothetical protein